MLFMSRLSSHSNRTPFHFDYMVSLVGVHWIRKNKLSITTHRCTWWIGCPLTPTRWHSTLISSLEWDVWNSERYDKCMNSRLIRQIRLQVTTHSLILIHKSPSQQVTYLDHVLVQQILIVTPILTTFQHPRSR